MVIYGNLKIKKKMITENTTIREFLQTLGTECLRDNLSKNIWAAALFADYKPLMSVSFGIMDLGASTLQMEKMSKSVPIEYPNWIITDMRFPNEAQAIKDKGGIIIHVERPFVKPINDHPSEVGLDYWDFDYAIGNVSDLVSLEFTVENILKEIKVL